MRIDYYINENRIYLGEVTCHTASGFQRMIPAEIDKILDEELKLLDRLRGWQIDDYSVFWGKPNMDGIDDYKFFCFDGKVKALFVATDRMNPREETKFDFFDDKFNHLPFINGHPNASDLPQKPELFEEMKRLSEILSKGIPHVRVDYYEIDGKLYFGELTFAHWSGMVPFIPSKWDTIFGDWISLPRQ